VRLAQLRFDVTAACLTAMAVGLVGCQGPRSERQSPSPELGVAIVHDLQQGFKGDDVQDAGGCLTGDGDLIYATAVGEIFQLDEQVHSLLPPANARESITSLVCGDGGLVGWIQDNRVDTISTFDVNSGLLRSTRITDASAITFSSRRSVLIAAETRLLAWFPHLGKNTAPVPVGAASSTMSWPEDVEITSNADYAALVEPGGAEVWRLNPWPPEVLGFLRCDCWDAGLSTNADPPVAALATGDRVRLLRLDTGRAVETLKLRPPSVPTSVVGAPPPELGIAAVSPTGRYVAAGWPDPPTLTVWDRETDEEVLVEVGPGPPARISWTATDNYLLVELGASAEGNGNLLQVKVTPRS